MLVLTRKINEQIRLGDNITVTILQINKGCIRLGIKAPRDLHILRSELAERDEHERVSATEPKSEPGVSINGAVLPQPAFEPVSKGLSAEAFTMLELDVETLSAELLEQEEAEQDRARLVQSHRSSMTKERAPKEEAEVQVEKTRDGVVYQTRRRAPLSSFVRSSVRESDLAYSLF